MTTEELDAFMATQMPHDTRIREEVLRDALQDARMQFDFSVARDDTHHHFVGHRDGDEFMRHSHPIEHFDGLSPQQQAMLEKKAWDRMRYTEHHWRAAKV